MFERMALKKTTRSWEGLRGLPRRMDQVRSLLLGSPFSSLQLQNAHTRMRTCARARVRVQLRFLHGVIFCVCAHVEHSSCA